MSETPKRRPWWAVAIAGGFGAVLGVAYLFAGQAAKAAPVDQDRLARIEAKVDQLTEKVARIEGRLERK